MHLGAAAGNAASTAATCRGGEREVSSKETGPHAAPQDPIEDFFHEFFIGQHFIYHTNDFSSGLLKYKFPYCKTLQFHFIHVH